MSTVEKGNPVPPTEVPLLDLKRAWPDMREEVLAEIADVFDDCDFILGKRTAALEEEIAALCRVPHGAACNSGTDALLLGLLALGVERGGVRQAVLCVELETGESANDTLTAELLALGAAHEHTRPIQTVLHHSSFPVDVRHNAKIFREKLAVWAQNQNP